MRKHRHAAQRLQEHTTNTANANAKSAEHITKENAAINQKTKHPFEVLFLYPKTKSEVFSGITKNYPHNSSAFSIFGGDDRDRTDDLLNAIQTLSQLSYTPA